jgi:hypothetical protein
MAISVIVDSDPEAGVTRKYLRKLASLEAGARLTGAMLCKDGSWFSQRSRSARRGSELAGKLGMKPSVAPWPARSGPESGVAREKIVRNCWQIDCHLQRFVRF